MDAKSAWEFRAGPIGVCIYPSVIVALDDRMGPRRIVARERIRSVLDASNIRVSRRGNSLVVRSPDEDKEPRHLVPDKHVDLLARFIEREMLSLRWREMADLFRIMVEVPASGEHKGRVLARHRA